jgi:hypothetical protein
MARPKTPDATVKQTADKRSPVAEAIYGLIMSAVTVGLLIYLQRSGMVCPPEASTCMISATLAEGWLVLIPLLIARFAFDMVVQLVFILRHGPSRLTAGMGLLLGLADAGLLLFMLFSGVRNFIRVDWLASLWQMPQMATLAGPLYSLVILVLLVLHLRGLRRSLRRFSLNHPEF